MRRVPRLPLVLLLLGAVAVSLWYGADYWIERSHAGPIHTYLLKTPHEVLPEELALRYAREAMAADGYELTDWQPLAQGEAKTDEGEKEVFFSRNTLNANEGYIVFVRRSDIGKGGAIAHRTVRVEMTEKSVVAQIWLPK